MRPASKKLLASIAIFGVAVWICLSAWHALRSNPLFTKAPTPLSYSRLLDDAKTGLVKRATITSSGMLVNYADGREFEVNTVNDPFMASTLYKHGVDVAGSQVTTIGAGGGWFWPALLSFGCVLLILGGWGYFRSRKGGMTSKSGKESFGKSKAKLQRPDELSAVTFSDVAGCDEAKEEVAELVDFLRFPSKYQRLGGRIPRGVLLCGSPGTGKTLLAKAIAGEAKVPFFSIAGSDFVEMFVGVGASRVRDLFAQAKAAAPCIVFIDEIDAVGRKRGVGNGGGNDEREQTLNQMLVEMDGFEAGSGVIVLAATNRPDVLDSALVRPGRFDRQVYVALPDVRGREQILNVHLRKVPAGVDVEPAVLARGTPGFSGADLANLVNEASLFAARRGSKHVRMDDFEKAKDKGMLGAERKIVMPEDERRNTAYHESGHAVVAELLTKTDPVHKVTIIPRGRALGVTMQLPKGDRYSTDKVRLENTIAVLFGGRIAEVLFIGEATTGASNDYERATSMARNMVTRWGYSDVVGPMVIAPNETDPAAGHFVAQETLREADLEIKSLLKAQYARVEVLLAANSDKIHAMAAALLEWETIDVDQVQDVMMGRPVRPPKSQAVPPTAPKLALTDSLAGKPQVALA